MYQKQNYSSLIYNTSAILNDHDSTNIINKEYMNCDRGPKDMH